MKRTLLGVGSPIGIGLIAALAVAGPVFASGWNPSVLIGTSSNGVAWMNSVATTSNGTAVAVFSDPTGEPNSEYGVFLSRSTTGGASWSKAVRLSAPGSCNASGPAVSANGSNVDVAWDDYTVCVSGDYEGAVWTAHSSDNGKTFGTPQRLSPKVLNPGVLDIASASNGAVLVGWTEDATGNMYVRSSGDFGASFAARKSIGVTSAHPYETAPDRLDGSVTVALGDSVAYVGYLSTQSTVKVRRSVDSGATWSSPLKLASDADGFSEIDVAAEHSRAVLAYAATNGSTDWARYRETTNAGVTWPGTTNLTTKTQPSAWYTAISLNGGTVRAAFTRCITLACGNQAVYYRQRVGTASLSSIVRVSESGGASSLGAFTAGVAASNGKPVVVYFTENNMGTFVFARSKS